MMNRTGKLIFLATAIVAVAGFSLAASVQINPSSDISISTGESREVTVSTSDSASSLWVERWSQEKNEWVSDEITFSCSSGCSVSNAYFKSQEGTVELRGTMSKNGQEHHSSEIEITWGEPEPSVTVDIEPSGDVQKTVSETVDIDAEATGKHISSIWIERWSDEKDEWVADEFRSDCGSTSCSTSHTYTKTQPGSIEVRARAVASAGSQTAKDTSSTTDITWSREENQPPTASFTQNTDGLTVNVDASSSSDEDGSIESYEWDWDDDGDYEDTGIEESHTYSSEGEYEVTLRVTDDDGAEDTKTRPVSVEEVDENEDPDAEFTYSPSTPEVDETVSFDATDSSDEDGSIESYEWDLDDDGNYDDATGIDAEESFGSAGDHDVSLRVTDNDGAEDTRTRTVTVSSPGDGGSDYKTCSVVPGILEVQPDTVRRGDSTTTSIVVFNQGDDQQVKVAFRTDYGGEKQVTKTIPKGGQRSFSAKFTPEEDTEITAHVKTVENEDGDSPCGSRDLGIQDVDVNVFSQDSSQATLDVIVEDEDGDRIRNARVDVENGEDETDFTNSNGKASFVLDPDTYHVTVSGPSDTDFDTETRRIHLADGEDDSMTFVLEGDRVDDGSEDPDNEEEATLDVNVEDEDGDAINNAEVEVINGDDEEKETDGDGQTSFTLEPDEYDVIVSKSGYLSDSKEITLESGEEREVSFTLESIDDADEEDATLDVHVKDEDNDPLEDADVAVINGDDEDEETDGDGDASFTLEPDEYDVIVSKSGYQSETREVDLDPGEEEEIEFTLEEIEDDESTLEVNVEDEDSDPIRNAEVEVENGDDETEDTNRDGRAFFVLEPDNYEVTVSKSGYETETEDIELDEGDEEELDFTLERTDDRDEEEEEKDVRIESVSFSDSVCRGESLVVDTTVSNTGDYLETVSLTGSGLGSIVAAGSFTLEEGETKTRRTVFTNVEGSGTESFTVTATNHNSDKISRTVEVKDCPADPSAGKASGISLELNPDRVRAGEAVKVSGFVDGVRGRKEVRITVNGQTAAEVNTQPDGYYQTFITASQVGDLTVTATTDSERESRRLEVLPTTSTVYADAPQQVFEGEEFEICGKVNSQITPRVDLVKDGRVIDSKNKKGEVCFERTATGVGEHRYRIVTVARGFRSSAVAETEVLETDVEAESFPDQIASVESGDGIVRVTLYNNHREMRRYDLEMFGVPSHWSSQTEKQVILQPGEEKQVFFYITPKNEGVFTTELKVTSEGDTVHRQQVRIVSGGTNRKTSTSWLDRLFERFSL